MTKFTNTFKKLALLNMLLCMSFLLFANDTFTLINSEEIATAPGEEVCVAVTCQNFTDIIGVQYDFSWDPTVLQFDAFSNIHDSLVQLQYNEVNPGLVKISWVDFNVSGVSLPDETLVYDICFTVLGNVGSESPVSFEVTNPVEIINNVLLIIPWVLVDGGVAVGGASSSFVFDDATSSTIACGSPIGTIDFNVSGGQMPYSFLWEGPGGFTSTDQNLTNLDLGIYSVTATDDNGDEITANALVEQGDGISFIGQVTPATCMQNDGSIDVEEVEGGIAPYIYEWSNGETTQDIVNLATGNYTLTVTDVSGCSGVSSYFVNESGFEGAVGGQITNPSCTNPLGAIDVTVFELNPPYTFDWSTGETTEDIYNLTVGIYALSVTDGSGCSDVTYYEVLNDDLVLYSYFNCDFTTGLSELFVLNWTGDNQVYTYEWSTGAITTTDSTLVSIDNLSPGDYFVTVSGTTSNCSEVLGPMTVNCSNMSPNSCFVLNASSANGNTGDQVCLDVSANGFNDIHAAQFTMAWDTSVMVFSQIQNYYDSTFQTVFMNDDLLLEGKYVFVNTWGTTIPFGKSIPDGSVLYQLCFDLVGAPGSSTDVVFVDGPVAYEVYSDNFELLGFNAFSGEVTVGAVANTLSLSDLCVTPPGCINASAGSVDIEVEGGNNSYAYMWLDAAGNTIATTEDLNGVDEGYYEVVVTDADGNTLTAFANVKINAPSIYTSYVTPVSCDGSADGSIQIGVQAGTGNYTYSWSNGNTASANVNLTAGTYTVTVSDDEGCHVVQDYVVNSPAPITVTEVDQTCPSEAGGDGTLNISASGGFNVFTYNWSNGDTTQDLDSLDNGTYEVTVSDLLGCTANASFYLGDCVWPGDTDSNGVVNNFDLLSIGLAYGATGPIRSNASIAWTPQPSDNWNDSTPNSMINYKHIDTNGEGLIDDTDTIAIVQNWGETHNFLGSTSGLVDLPPNGNFITVPFYVQPDTFEANTTVSLPVILGDINNQVDEIYGLAFIITFDPDIVVPGSAYLTFDNSWIGTINSDMISIQKTFHSDGRLDIGLTRIDGANISGQGMIGSFNITIEDDIVEPFGLITGMETVFGIEKVRIITVAEEEVIVNPVPTTSLIETPFTGVNDLEETFDLQLFPNPVSDQLTINSNEVLIELVTLFDVTGKQLLHVPVQNQKEVILKTKQLASGTYIAKILTDKGLAIRRIVVQSNESH